MISLQTKCLAGSAALHAALLLALVLAPLLIVAPTSKTAPPLRLVSSRLVDEALSRRPRNPTPPVQVQVPTPVEVVAPAPQIEPEPIRAEPPRPAPTQVAKPPTVQTPVARSLPPTPTPKPDVKSTQAPPTKAQKAVSAPPTKAAPTNRQVALNTNAINRLLQDRQKAVAAAAAAEAAEKRREEEAEKARMRAALQEFSRTVGRQSQGLSIEIPGAAEAQYLDYKQIVEQAYTRAWQAPAELSSSSAQVTVQVVIARSGRVVLDRTRITKRSGVRALDDSVERALKLEMIEPFSTDSRDNERTFIIHFDLKSKAYSG